MICHPPVGTGRGACSDCGAPVKEERHAYCAGCYRARQDWEDYQETRWRLRHPPKIGAVQDCGGAAGVTWAAVGVVIAAIAGQAFWIAHALGELGRRLDRIDSHLDRIETTVLADHADRIARLEDALPVVTEPPPETGPIPRLALDRSEAAAALGMSLDSFERHVQPTVRMVRLGRMRLVPISELERWLVRARRSGRSREPGILTEH